MRFLVSNAGRWAVLVAAGVLALAHPLIHGTPLDSGSLDSLMTTLQAMAVSQR